MTLLETMHMYDVLPPAKGRRAQLIDRLAVALVAPVPEAAFACG